MADQIKPSMAPIIAEIRIYAKLAGIEPKTVTGRALKHNGRFSKWLEGAEALPSTIQRVREWMDENPPETYALRKRSAGDAA